MALLARVVSKTGQLIIEQMKTTDQLVTKDLIAQHGLTDGEYDIVSSWGRGDGERPSKTVL